MEAFVCDSLIIRLADHFGARISEQRRRSYYEHLRGMKESTLKQAVFEIEDRWVPERGEDKMPSIKHIRQVCNDIEARFARTERIQEIRESPPTEEEWVNSRAVELACLTILSSWSRAGKEKESAVNVLDRCRRSVQERVDAAKASGRMNIRFASQPSEDVKPEEYDPFAED